MARGRSLRTEPVVTRSRASALHSESSRLPAELVTEILEYLDLDDLWQAAAVSRAFYAAARRARLYIHRNIRWRRFDDCAADLSTFREVVEHVLQKGLLLSFSFSAIHDDEWDPQKQSSGFETMRPVFMELFSIVTAALPVLVFLELQMNDHFGPIMDAALRYPAPRLEELGISWTSELCTHTVPVDLFNGSAPQLRVISLNGVPLGLDPIPAFFMIEAAAFDYADVYPDIDFPLCFPCLRSLRLTFFSENGALPPPRFKLDGLSLQKLTIDDCDDYPLIPSLERSIKLADIPVIEHMTDAVCWAEPLWQPNSNDPLSIRLMHYEMPDSDMSIYIVPEHRKWRRTYHLHTWYPGYECPLARMPGVSDRLTYLRMGNLYLIGFLECDCLTLDALRDLQVDFDSGERRARMLWPPDWLHTLADEEVSFDESDRSTPTFAEESYHYIYCRSLETLTLFALDTFMSVESREAAFLGRALSQTSRRKKERAALVLMGMEFHKPVARTLLNQTYSVVRCYEFAGYDSLADLDEGLWDEEI